ncbi:hypothetical protein U1Q18_051023 [Sarracenia purpurea var. burkii]
MPDSKETEKKGKRKASEKKEEAKDNGEKEADQIGAGVLLPLSTLHTAFLRRQRRSRRRTITRSLATTARTDFFLFGLLETISYIAWKKCTTDLRLWYTNPEDRVVNNSLFLKSALGQLFKSTLAQTADGDDATRAMLHEIFYAANFENASQTLTLGCIVKLKQLFPGLRNLLGHQRENANNLLLEEWDWFLDVAGIFTRASSRFATQCFRELQSTDTYFKTALLHADPTQISAVFKAGIFSADHVKKYFTRPARTLTAIPPEKQRSLYKTSAAYSTRCCYVAVAT